MPLNATPKKLSSKKIERETLARFFLDQLICFCAVAREAEAWALDTCLVALLGYHLANRNLWCEISLCHSHNQFLVVNYSVGSVVGASGKTTCEMYEQLSVEAVSAFTPSP